MPRLDELFEWTQAHGGSDLHLAAGLEPRVRVHGHLEAIEGWPVLTDAALQDLMRELVDEPQWLEYMRTGDLDFAYGLTGVGRFRGNFLRQQNGAGAVFRRIPEKIVPLEALNLPAAIGKLSELERGLVLVTGPTGSGKSTTLAAIIDRINSSSARHIVTIEDPVEFVHTPKMCLFSQREVGADTDGFAGALRAATRQDADVILVGEMRDLETISMAVAAAEMGSLVFGTLHTSGAANTIDRLIDAFPADQQAQIRVTLSESLVAIVSQLLLPTIDAGGRVAAIELLFRTQGLPNVIREGNTPMLRSIIQSGKSEGMILMDDALMDLVERKVVSPHDAYLKASDKVRFEAFIKEREGAQVNQP